MDFYVSEKQYSAKFLPLGRADASEVRRAFLVLEPCGQFEKYPSNPLKGIFVPF